MIFNLDKRDTPRVLYRVRGSDFIMGGDSGHFDATVRATLVAGLCFVLIASFSMPAMADSHTQSAEAIWVKNSQGVWCLEDLSSQEMIFVEPVAGVSLHPIAGAKVLVTFTADQEGVWTVYSETFISMTDSSPDQIGGGEDGEVGDSGSGNGDIGISISMPTNFAAPLIAIIGALVLTLGLATTADEPTRARVVASLGRFSDLSVTEGPGTLAGNYQRGRITGFLTAHPGCHLSGLIRALELGNHQAVHHLRILEQDSKVWCRRDGRLLRYYTEKVNRHAELSRLPRPADVNQLSDVALMILRSIAEQAPESRSPSQRELATELKTSQQLISHHLRRLENQGLISRERRGLRTRRVLTNEGERVWERLQIPPATS